MGTSGASIYDQRDTGTDSSNRHSAAPLVDKSGVQGDGPAKSRAAAITRKSLARTHLLTKSDHEEVDFPPVLPRKPAFELLSHSCENGRTELSSAPNRSNHHPVSPFACLLGSCF